MANVLSLAMKVSADASSVPRQLTPVERALAGLSKEAEKATSVMDKFAASSSAAAAAQARSAADFEKLAAALESRSIKPEEYARQFAALTAAANDTAAAFAEGARITEQARTTEERRAAELERLTQLLELGAINEETFSRASAEASGANAEAARAERERADAAAAAARIIRANLTPQERYDEQMRELAVHLNEGRLSQEQFNRAAARARRDLQTVGREAGNADKSIDRLNRNVGILAKIEIGRLAIDGLQALSRTFTSVTRQIASVAASVSQSLDSLNDLSARTGIAVEALQGYSLAAKLAGVDTEAFGVAVQKLAVNIGKATPGDALDKALRSINLSLAELRQLSPEQQFSEIGQAISQLPTAAERAAAAVAIFGRQGAALAPLFREGAASIEELKARAERLGIIVSEQQINNVADMNDAFDLVRATVEGIIGQVIGNLAPAVTAVTEEFLRFVEEWSGIQGEGGTGIANAITDVLLEGAEYFAGVFEFFVGGTKALTENLAGVGQTFKVVANILTAAVESLRVVFNVFEGIGNGIILGLGAVLEGIGSYVSEDLELLGRDIQASAAEQLKRNEEQLTAAAENAASAITDAFTGGENSPQAAGDSAAVEYLRGIRERIERERSPEFRIETNIDATRERFDAFFAGIVDDSSAITTAMREFEATVAAAQQGMVLTKEEIQQIAQAQARVNELIDQETAARREAADAAASQLEADQKRVDELLKKSVDATVKVEEDIAAVERLVVETQQQLQAARSENNAEAANAAAARLAQLDQLQAQLDDQLQAAEQGFGQAGFGPAFEQINAGLNQAAEKAAEFGNAGAQAFAQLQQGVAEAQQQARDGILNREALEQQVAAQQRLFEQELANIDAANEKRKAAAADQAEQRKQLEQDSLRQQEEQAKAQQQAQQQLQEAYFQEQQRIAEERRKAEEAEFARQQERLRQLNTLGEGVVNTADVRTQEGAAIVLGLAANAQDPRLIEARLTNKLMRQQLNALVGNLTRIGLEVSLP